LEAASKGYTSITIAHRLSTIMGSGEIISALTVFNFYFALSLTLMLEIHIFWQT
jgi:ABC-type transport system involved in Fe-S cluster assembly fused permease/ATPase subunit